MGLAQQVDNDLWLKDGVYSLWVKEQTDSKVTGKNVNAVHPFVMGRDTQNHWFGVFSNVAAAQDWWITNDEATGNVNIKMMATGGVGDLFFMFESNPNALV